MSISELTIPSFLGGVSQKSPVYSRPEQADEIENMWLDSSVGAKGRPGTRVLAETATAIANGPHQFPIETSTGEVFVIDVTSTGMTAIRIRDENGADVLDFATIDSTQYSFSGQTISWSAQSVDYMAGTPVGGANVGTYGNARQLVIGDIMLLLNRTVPTDWEDHAPDVTVKYHRKDYTEYYTVSGSGKGGGATTPYKWVPSLGYVAGDYCEHFGGVWNPNRALSTSDTEFDPEDWDLQTEATPVPGLAFMNYPVVTDIGEDPTGSIILTPGYSGARVKLRVGTVCEIVGGAAAGEKYVITDITPNAIPASNPKKIVWKINWASADFARRPKSTLMPHVLRYEGSQTFSFEPVDWDPFITTPRQRVTPAAGQTYTKGTVFDTDQVATDDLTWPDGTKVTTYLGLDKFSNAISPSFLPFINASDGVLRAGIPITDLEYHRSRIALSAGDSVVMTRTNDLFNLFPADPDGEVLATDPIDISMPGSGTADLKTIIGFSGQLIASSNKRQFLISSTEAMSATTVTVKKASEYNWGGLFRPITFGDQLIYTNVAEGFSRVYTYFFVNDDQSFQAIELTKDTPKYISGDIEYIVGSTVVNKLLVWNGSSTEFITYDFTASQENPQTAWSKHTFPNNALDGGEIGTPVALGNDIYFIWDGGDHSGWADYYLSKLYLSNEPNDTGLTYNLKMDMKRDITGVLSGSTVTWDLSSYVPITANAPTVFVTDDGAVWTDADLNASDELVVNNVGTNLVIGFTYDSRIKLLELFARDREGEIRINGRFQLYRMDVVHRNAARYTIKTTVNGEDYEQDYDASTIGIVDIGDAVTIEEDSASFPLLGESKTTDIEISNATPFPATFISATITGDFSSRIR